MDSTRLATALAVVATVVVGGTALAAGATYLARDDAAGGTRHGSAADVVVVRDRRTGASFEVPAVTAWSVEGAQARLYYAGPDGRPQAVVRGPAVFREGYCAARPDDSSRAFAGFTRQDFATWADALARSDGRAGGWSTGIHRRTLELADGSTARLTSSDMFTARGRPCGAPGVAVSMVETGRGSHRVRLVLVRDTDGRGTLPDRAVERLLSSLRRGD